MPAKKKGRPRGSKNRDFNAVVAEVPPTCVHCGSENHRVLPGNLRRMEQAGKLPDGREYSAIEWRRMQCNDCQGVFMKKRYCGLAKNNSGGELIQSPTA